MKAKKKTKTKKKFRTVTLGDLCEGHLSIREDLHSLNKHVDGWVRENINQNVKGISNLLDKITEQKHRVDLLEPRIEQLEQFQTQVRPKDSSKSKKLCAYLKRFSFASKSIKQSPLDVFKDHLDQVAVHSPKFWVRYLDDQHITSRDPFLYSNCDPYRQMAPIYCFTREMLINLARNLYSTTHCDYALMVDQYLKSEGEV